jgi:hypothetical protein
MTDIATQLEDAAHAFARGDDASMDLITNAVRELRERDEAVGTMTSYYDRIQKLQQRELELASLLGRAVYYVRFHKTAAACELDDEIKAAFPTAK